MEYPKLEKEYPVHVYDTGPDGHLSLHALFDYFQDIASDHAVRPGYGVNLHTNTTSYLNWVTDTYDLDFMLRNAPLSVEINYLSESRFNDSVEILTSGNGGDPCLFSHSVILPADSTELCTVRILWKRILS